MKKTFTAMACALALVLSASTANALTLAYGDEYYLGFVDPGTPASQDINFINWLLALEPGGLDTDSHQLKGGKDPEYYIVSREDSPAGLCAVGTCDPALPPAEDVTTNLLAEIDVSGYTYLLGKYGNVAHVWVVSSLDKVFLPNKLDLDTGEGETLSGGLSNYGRVNGSVPDGGATLGLLGLAMLGVGYLRRRMA